MIRDTVRIIVTRDCNRSCINCVNNDWKGQPPIILTEDLSTLKNFEIIILTGGEPGLVPELTFELVGKIRAINKEAKLYIYTSLTSVVTNIALLSVSDGITVTLHDTNDLNWFNSFNSILLNLGLQPKDRSLRLNVFMREQLISTNLTLWEVQYMNWIKDCTLPKNEILYELDKKYANYKRYY